MIDYNEYSEKLTFLFSVRIENRLNPKLTNQNRILILFFRFSVILG